MTSDTRINPLPSASLLEDFAERLEGHVLRRACGQIRDLHATCNDGRIVLQGRSRTYHAKQLAQEAALDFTQGLATSLDNEIEVC